jgi:hypothetical protein
MAGWRWVLTDDALKLSSLARRLIGASACATDWELPYSSRVVQPGFHMTSSAENDISIIDKRTTMGTRGCEEGSISDNGPE